MNPKMQANESIFAVYFAFIRRVWDWAKVTHTQLDTHFCQANCHLSRRCASITSGFVRSFVSNARTESTWGREEGERESRRFGVVLCLHCYFFRSNAHDNRYNEKRHWRAPNKSYPFGTRQTSRRGKQTLFRCRVKQLESETNQFRFTLKSPFNHCFTPFSSLASRSSGNKRPISSTWTCTVDATVAEPKESKCTAVLGCFGCLHSAEAVKVSN
jgi:hypothetical protein